VRYGWMRGAVFVSLLMVLAACATYQLVPPGETTVRNAIAVAPSRAWTKVPFINSPGPLEMWTLNGPAIDTLQFYAPVADGEALRKAEGNAQPYPPFRASMSASEIVELYEATLRRATDSALVETKNLRPATVGGLEGFRADVVYVGKDRVRRKGVLVGAVKGKALYLMHFQAPELHYYDLAVDEVERIVASARVL
jgi:hypothetical protein